MVQKRPLAGDDSCVVSSKHAKFGDNNKHLVSFLEFPDLGWKPYTSGEKSCCHSLRNALCITLS